MEADGLVQRKDDGEIPPRVDYTLTDRVRSLKPVVPALGEWAVQTDQNRGATQ